jgi:UDP-N-acetylglucosamine--N-acetylmuramyl-(pentapeptide) pyrophosphoryl-undecaprenol N-acetylglucosamine transferase
MYAAENRQDGTVSQTTRIVIAAGGTAGHVAPALAVANALRAQGAQVTFIGGARAEAQMVPAAGYELRTIAVEGVSRTNPLRALCALARAAMALPRARRMLKELRPDAVMGGGGYVTAPVGAAALSLRMPLVLTEADSHLGLANRLLARGARRVCLALPIPGQDHAGAGARYRVTGRPIPVADADRDRARLRFGVGENEMCVLVFGGSLGARSINLAAIEGLVDTSAHVLHISGRRDYPELSARELPAGYDLREYLDLEEFAQALAAADLVIARAGGSIAEIAAYGVPAILVPYAHASADHQSANARWMADAGAAVVVPDRDLTGARLAAEASALLGDRERLAAMSAAAKGLARPDAAGAVAGELLRAANVAPGPRRETAVGTDGSSERS